MVAFTPISPTAARQILTGACSVDEGQFLSAFVEAGVVKAYAAVMETLTADGDRNEVRQGRIPPAVWRRIVTEGKLEQALTLGSLRLDGDGLVGGRPALMVTGIRFNEDNVRKVAAEHGPTPLAQPVVPAMPVAPKAIKVAAATPVAEPKQSGAPPSVEIMDTALISQPPARRGLAADAVTVTIKEACEILGIGRTKMNELIKGDLEVKRIGRSVKIKADSIRDYLARD